MEITEVRIKLMEEPGERLRAFCSVTFDSAFVIRDLKIIDGTNGPFVAMPSRKLTARCPQCRSKNHLRANYCNQCGLRLSSDREIRDDDGRSKLYADIAHPINSTCREMIQTRLLEAYDEEVERAKQPDYVPSFYDYDSEESTASAAEDYARREPNVQTAQRDECAPTRHEAAHAAARGPHQSPAPRPAQKQNQEFGAGIFDS